MDYNSFDTTSVLQKLWETELESEGRDYSIGIKVPFYMQECGLHNIDVRISDKVNFINPYRDKNEYDKLLNSLIVTNDWNRSPLWDKMNIIHS